MTVIVGIALHDDQIIMASDSQTTDGNRKRLDAKKIHVVSFRSDAALIAESGVADLSARAVAMIKERAGDRDIDSNWAVANLCQEVMNDIRKMMCAGYPAGFSPETLQAYIEKEREFSLTIAHFWNDKPRFFTISNSTQIAKPVISRHVTNGCGAALAGFVIEQYCQGKMDFGAAAGLAIYAVEKVKQTDSHCGGPTQFAMLQNFTKEQHAHLQMGHPGVAVAKSNGWILPATWAAAVTAEIPRMEEETRAQLKESMKAAFAAIVSAVPPPGKSP